MKTKLYFNKMLAILLVVSILATLASGLSVNADASTDTRVVDASTMDDWKNYFGETVLNTENAGGVWGDKSVFKDASAFSSYGITMDDADNNFLIVLSAIASNKSIIGYSSIPTDTMLVLDLSNSMSNTAMSNMISATNAAIRKLLDLNLNNRVGVVLYSGTSRTNTSSELDDAIVLLPLGRYTGVGDEGEEQFVTYSTQNDTVSVVEGVLDLDRGERLPSKAASGATYIQAGIQLAWNEFNAVEDTTVTSGPQSGTKRMPVLVLMSDGAPTSATTSYTNVGKSTHGNGSSTSATNSFLTQLSCAWVRAKMVEKYDRSGLFYTLGLNVDNDNNAKAVLDPANSYNTLTSWWKSYLSATDGSNVSFSTGNGGNSSSFTVKKDNAVTEMNYVDSYFSASNEAGLVNAFERIVDQIIIQSKYYPTLVQNGDHNLDGYITFTDELGEYMEVKSIKGLTVHGELYEGYRIAQAIVQGEFGNIADGDLSKLDENGHEVLKAIEKRLGCTEDQAITAVTQALRTGQLIYTDEENFSNYIGWYADADGNYLGFWDGGSTANKPEGAVYVNKSYGFLGEVGSEEEYNLTDMLYISVQVLQNIESGHQMVIYKIPASLVPMVSYNIAFDGDNLETGTNYQMSIDGAEEPLRLIFEVGLRSDINRINISDKIDTFYQYKSDAGYNFYTNSWNPHTHTNNLVDTHDATFFDFKPSLENERYYYTYDSTIYDAAGNAVTSNPVGTNDTYYHKVTVFTTKEAGLSAATKEERMVPIHAETLVADVVKYNETTSTYYIPKDTPYRLLENLEHESYAIQKADQTLTNTLEYSNYPSVVLPEGEDIYHADACLGNNGLFTVAPAQGIQLSKIMEYPELGQDEIFTFAITLTGSDLASSYPIYNYDGEKLGDAVKNADDKYIVTLKAGETVYIVDIPTGTEYVVEEILADDSEWMINSSSGVTGTIAQYVYSEVSFENTPKVHGNLIIGKTVTHQFGEDYEMPDKAFDITVTLEGVAEGTLVQVNGVPTAVSNEKLDLTIKHNEAIIISQIPEGTVYTVTEAEYPGFTLQNADSYTGTISSETNAEAALVNNYVPSEVSPVNVSHIGEKHLGGRDWQEGDTFTFELQYFNGVNWETVDGWTREIDENTANHQFTFNDVIQNFTFDSIGTYQFRILEQFGDIGGVAYDILEKKFEIIVTDDFSGKLLISDVTTTTPRNGDSGVTVTEEADEYVIETHFHNVYSVSGSTAITIDITKVIGTNNTGLEFGPDGFTFEVREGSTLIDTSTATDSAGKTSVMLTFDASRVGETITYTVKEVNGGVDGVIYDSHEETFTVAIVDNLDGTIGAWINGEDVDTFYAAFENSYVLQATTIEISGSKTLNGRDLEDNEFTFKLYRCDDADFSNPVEVDSAQNVNKAFTLTDSIGVAGTYYYIVDEDVSGKPGVTDDTNKYYVVVNVVKGEGDTLTYVIESVEKVDTEGSRTTVGEDEIAFVNEYAPTGSTSIIIDITKVIGTNDTGLVFGPDGFKFEVKENGSVVATSDTTNSEGKTSVELTFDASRVGEIITYTVKEIDDGVDGVVYDTHEETFTVEIVDNFDGTISALINDVDEDTYSATFENDYVLSAAEIEISGSKTLNGRDLADNEFTFKLYRCDDAAFSNPVEVDSAKNVNKAFTLTDSISVAGTYYYIVDEEVSGKVAVTDDTNKYYVVVTVEKGTGATLGYTIDSVEKVDTEGNRTTVDEDEIAFVNEYKPASDALSITAGKNLKGLALVGDDFTFKLYSADANFENLSELQEKKNDKDGAITFDEITYEKEDVLYYVIKEVNDGTERITYDETIYCITVTVTDEGGALKAEITEIKKYKGEDATVTTDAIIFENKYTPKPDDITVEISADKVVKNKGTSSIGPDGFHFVLENVTSNEEWTAISDAEGNIIFDAFTFTEDDIGKTYQYKLYEINDGVANVTYSTTVYEFAITITLNEDNVLVATFTQGEETVETIEATFENIYDYDIPVEIPPKTGDTNMMLWIVMLFISGGIFAVMKASEKMKKANGR